MNNDVSWNGAPPNILHTTFQTNNGLNIFSHTFVGDQSPIIQQNKLPPPPIDVEMVDQRHISSSDPNVGSDPVTQKTSTLCHLVLHLVMSVRYHLVNESLQCLMEYFH
ncbi:hypothetical protein H5410_029160 [Solanum commersonii]|uniref:Uncharacterized protein n=1 Tax=Solanum commersonii TaxID=4109 RepID=A0A9J5Z880_SOLCO|nr:hypothetical protein H5410_029160 [Solanum commersonii]